MTLKITGVLLFLISTILSIQTNAQTFSIKGGLNNSTINTSGSGQEGDISSKTGFHMGVLMTNPIYKIVSFESGLQFIQKGARYNYPHMSNDYDGNITMNCLNIPLALKTTFKLSDEINLFANGGIFLGVVFGGKEQITSGAFSSEYPYDYRTSNTTRYYSSGYNSGWTFGMGVEIKRYIIAISYDYGFSKQPIGDFDETRTRDLKFSIGYIFGKQYKFIKK